MGLADAALRSTGCIAFVRSEDYAVTRSMQADFSPKVQMKIAYLIDYNSLGGGMEYIRRQIAARPGAECRVFFSERGECKAAKMDAWGAEEIVVNHLKALVQLLGNPLRRPKGRVTFVVHGIHLRKYRWMMHEGCVPCLRILPAYWLRRVLEACLYHRCDRIVALTATDRDDILRLYGHDLKVDVEPNTLDGWNAAQVDALPVGIDGPFKYLCIGRFDYQKGQDRWIKRIKNEELRIKNAGSRTLFIGDGPTLAECKRLAEKLGVEDLCVFAGAIPDADRYLKCVEIVVSPSRWEGMPYLLMKARALNCRILATDCPGNRDVLAGYDNWEKLEL